MRSLAVYFWAWFLERLPTEMRGDIKTLQHRNWCKIRGNWSNYSFFDAFARFLRIFRKSPKVRFWGVSSFLRSIYQNFRSLSALFQWKNFKGFPNIFEGTPNILFYVRSLIFLIRFCFLKKLLNWSVSSYFRSVSSNFRSISSYFRFVSTFFKNFKNLNLLFSFLL